MTERKGNEWVLRPDEFLKDLCQGTGKMYKDGERMVCEIKDGRIEIDRDSIDIETDDAGISAPLDKIKYCVVFGDKHKKFGHCQFKRSGGILIQIDPTEKELVVMATRGPLTAQIAVDGDEEIPIKI